jgi:hypothetical protein
MAAPDSPVVITLRDVYEAVNRLAERVSGLVGQVEALREQFDRLDRQRDDHESRLRALERRQWPIPSAALLVSIVAVVITVISSL